MGVTLQGGPNGKRGNWGRELNRVLAPREQNYRMLWFVKKAFVLSCLTTVHEFQRSHSEATSVVNI